MVARHCFLVVGVLAICAAAASGKRILVAPCSGLYSHEEVFIQLGKSLYEAGHTVSLLKTTWFRHNKEATSFMDKEIEFSIRGNGPPQENLTHGGILDVWDTVVEEVGYVEDMLANKAIKEIKSSDYDLLVQDEDCLYWTAVAYHVGLEKSIQLGCSVPADPFSTYYRQIRAPASYVPMFGTPFTDQMNIIERAENLANYVVGAVLYFEVHRRLRALAAAHGKELVVKTFQMVQVPFAFDAARALPPNIQYVGSLLARPASPVPGALGAWLDGAVEGVALLSFGTVVKVAPTLMATLLPALGQLPIKVLCSLKADPASLPQPLPRNVRVEAWVPQNDVLGHPHVRAFVTHGGANSVMESLFHGVPVVGVPIAMDQPSIVARAVMKGAGLALPPSRLAELPATVMRVVEEPSFRASARLASRVMQAEPGMPVAVRWCEYIMKHGYSHLVVHHDFDMPTIQYYSLDVLAFLLAFAFCCRALLRWIHRTLGTAAVVAAVAAALGGIYWLVITGLI